MARQGAPRRALRGLAVALAISASVHAWVILEVEVSRPAGDRRGTASVLLATLRTGADSAVIEAPTPAQPAEPRISSASNQPSAGPPVAGPDEALPEPPAEPRPSVPRPVPEGTLPESVDVPLPQQAEVPGAPTEATGPAVQIPLVEDPEFYPARLLDVLPRPLAEVVLRYPDSAAAQDLSGRVVLLLLIDELGVVVEATVIEAEPPGYFEDAAIESFRDVLFQPAQRNGRAVKSRLPVEVTFDARTDSAKP